MLNKALRRADAFCGRFGPRLPILLAPMAGACPPSLSIAVANAGGYGACGALLMQPGAIAAWVAAMRAGSNGGFQLNWRCSPLIFFWWAVRAFQAGRWVNGFRVVFMMRIRGQILGR